MDIRSARAAIASVSTDTFAEILLHGRDEGVQGWQRETFEGDACGVEAAVERGDVEGLRWGLLLLADLVGPEVGGNLGLSYAVSGEVRVGPGDGGVAFEDGVVALGLSDSCIKFTRWKTQRTFQAGVPK
jgi:hypothetical protein